MSHFATNWAIEQRGLKPAAKIVLWHLADAHNPHHGCFPSQERLARECEMSRSTVNLHLKELEDRGLIKRRQSRCEQTNRQNATRYYLGFEKDEIGKKPCPKTGHGSMPDPVSENDEKPSPKNAESRVRNSDTNPVREPVSKTSNEREGAQARDDEGEVLEKDEPDVLADEDNPAKAAFETRIIAFCSGRGFDAGAWPDFDTITMSYHKREFAKLNEDERHEAETWRDAYLRDIALRKKKPVSPGNFFRDKLWRALDNKLLERDAKAKAQSLPADKQPTHDDWANAWGPVFNGFMIAQLLKGRQDGREGEGVPVMRIHVDAAYPVFEGLRRSAEQRKGARIKLKWHALKDAMAFISADHDDLIEAWRETFKAREWVWPAAFNAEAGVYLPKGGPEALDAFEEAVRETASDCQNRDGENDA